MMITIVFRYNYQAKSLQFDDAQCSRYYQSPKHSSRQRNFPLVNSEGMVIVNSEGMGIGIHDYQADRAAILVVFFLHFLEPCVPGLKGPMRN